MINVVEKPTGSIQLGAGFSSAEKVSLSFGIKQENVFGSGNYLGLDVNTSKYNRTMVVSTTNPYFTDTGISRTYDLYYRTTRPYYDDAAYKIITKGASVRFGVPFSEVDTIFFGAGVEGNEIKPGSYMPAIYNEYCGGLPGENLGCSKTGVPLTLGWSRDNRDSALAPNAGRYQRVNLEASFMSDMRYAKANYQIQQYIPLNKKYTIALNGELGWGKGLGGNPYPIFKNFYSGGLGSVRGFEQGSLGRRDTVNTNLALGGTRKLTLNGEFMVPFPGAGNDRTLRLFGFVDVGNVWAEGESMELSSLRASTGIGISWISPLGPLRLAYAQPIRKETGDRIQKLQFQIGTSF